MKKNEFLQDAIGLIDQKLVMQAGGLKMKRHTAPWIRWVAAAACLTLVLGGLWYLRPKGNPPTDPSTIEGNPGMIAENLWQREDFNAFSLSYRSADLIPTDTGHGGRVVFLTNTTSNAAPPPTLETKTISISQNQTVKFERLIAQRYAVYRSKTGFVMFYDTVEDRQVDLQERILGDTEYMLTALKETAYSVVETKYPGFLGSPVNRQILDLYLTYTANGTLSEHWTDITALTPDTEFLNALGYQHLDEEEKRSICWNLGWEVYVKCFSRMDEELLQKPYAITILGIDEANGICIIATKTISGNGDQFLVYDIRSDTFHNLTAGVESLNGMLQIDGYIFRFSKDGTVATVAYPNAHLDGGNLHGDLTQRFVIDTENRLVQNYQGENLGVYFLENGTCYEFNTLPGASELFVSSENSVLYYKQMDRANAGKTFHASDVVWYNRLKRYDRDTDCWVFYTIDQNKNIRQPIVLQGKFLRFAAGETIAILERGGKYYAYSLADGSEVTGDILAGTVSMYAHEQLLTDYRDGQLTVTNLFTGQQQVLGRADTYILSEDGAFVFGYCYGDNHVTCYNVASGNSCQISIHSELREQLFARPDAVLQMSYNAQENTLLLSYYIQQDVTTAYDTDVDFYSILGQLQDEDPESLYPDHPKVIRDMTVTEEVMEQFRNSAYRYDHPNGIISWETYYPEGMVPYQSKTAIFEWLGFTEPKNYLDVNGTQFILYEDQDETLLLTFWQSWLLFDYQDFYGGFVIEYIHNDNIYDYQFFIEKP